MEFLDVSDKSHHWKEDCHDICGRSQPCAMSGKPAECLSTELSLNPRPGDTFIVTFPKTGTTVLQYMCHLVITNCDTSFDDIHQVCPHTSSAWYVGQDLNRNTERQPRIFKSHRELRQVMPFSRNVKFISTIRDPDATLASLYSFRKARGEIPENLSITEFAASDKWTVAMNEGCVNTIFDHIATFWQCRAASNFLLIPYEDLVGNREKWIPVIAEFLGVACSSDLTKKVALLTSKEAMLQDISKFDESWCQRQRELLGRHHHAIKFAAPKVTQGTGHLMDDVEAAQTVTKMHAKLWSEKVTSVTGINNYKEMHNMLVDYHFPVTS